MSGWKRHFANAQMPLPGRPSVFSDSKVGTFDGFRNRLKAKFGDKVSMDKATALFKEIGLEDMANNEGEAATFFVPEDQAFAKMSKETLEKIKNPNAIDRETFLATHVVPQTIHHDDLTNVTQTFDLLHDGVKVTIFGERELPESFPKDTAYVMFHDNEGNELSRARIIVHAPAEKEGDHAMYLIDNTAGF